VDTTDVGTRAIRPADLPALLVRNTAAVPNVNALDLAGLARLVKQARVAEAVLVAGAPRGFVLALPPRVDYDSPNYLWFTGRFDDFLYVDRIVVDDNQRGNGLGGVLYGVVIDQARRDNAPMVACEVNLQPPNPGSLRFHGRLGFVEVGQQSTGDKVVAMLAKRL